MGGNGSGKTTFVRLLTGLYAPTSGDILVNGRRIEAAGRQRYRTLFGALFTDYHLFDRLYGLRTIDPERVADLLRTMRLEWKAHLDRDRFSTTALSHGQRKRLALTATLLEDKPVHMFDEFAVDQDPAFRRFFYEEMLVDLRRRGKTIVAVTHDDRYFGVADRVLRMADGRFVEGDLQGSAREVHRSSEAARARPPQARARPGDRFGPLPGSDAGHLSTARRSACCRAARPRCSSSCSSRPSLEATSPPARACARGTALAEGTVRSDPRRLADKIRRAEVEPFEQLDEARPDPI